MENKEILNEIIQEYKKQYNITLQELKKIKKAETRKEDNDLIIEFRNYNYNMSEVNDVMDSLENVLLVGLIYKIIDSVNSL